MTVSKATRDALGKLAEVLTQEAAGNLEAMDLMRGFRSGRLAVPGEEGGSLVMTGEDLDLYNDALNSLTQEPEMEHITRQDVDDELWTFAGELFLDQRKYRNLVTRRRAIRDLTDRLRRPWQDYGVVAAIENLTVREIDAADVRFSKLTERKATAWGLVGSPAIEDFRPHLVGGVAAWTSVRAGSAGKAAEKARLKIDDALDVLRVALSGAILARISDQSLLWRRHFGLAVKAEDSGWIEHLTWQRSSHPSEFQLRRAAAEPVRRRLRPINEFLANEAIPQKLRSRLLRALHWIGSSMLHEHYDDKVVNLCTALETLLTVRSEGRKAEAIALRSMLLPGALGKGFAHPCQVYELYELRNLIVHGSAFRVAGDKEYRTLRWLATEMIDYFVAFLSRNPEIKTQGQFLTAISPTDALEQAANWFEAQPNKSARSTEDFARRLMAADT